MQSQSSSAIGVGGAGGATRKARKTRGRGLRTSTGCIVCRKRHLKCNETKPICGQCSKTNRACIYGTLDANASETNGIEVTEERGPALVAPSERGSAHQQTALSNVGPRSATNGDPTSTEMRSPLLQQWPNTPITGELLSPQSAYSSPAYGTEVAPLRWLTLLVAGDAASAAPNASSLENLSDAAATHCYEKELDGNLATQAYISHGGRHRARLAQGADVQPLSTPQLSSVSLETTYANIDERQFWQRADVIQLKGHEFEIFERFVSGASLWNDLFDPQQSFSTYVPHLALHNEGLMNAVLALGARYLSIQSISNREVGVDRTNAVKYYYETLKYLQSAMRFTTYKNSLELLATVLVVSTFEMVDGAGQDWERHLKGVFWIQRSRDINGESGGLQQAIWWSWLRQDVWAAFREQRRCFSFFMPTKSYEAMDIMEVASRMIYLLAQCVNYSSQEEKHAGQSDLGARILRANALLDMLQEWKSHTSAPFKALPVEGPSDRAFKPLWIHPPAVGASVQMHSMARILLLVSQPSAGGYTELLSREEGISECVDTIGGIALRVNDDAARVMSTQCLFAAGLYCSDEAKRACIAELITHNSAKTGWPPTTNLAEELQKEWDKPRSSR